MSGSQLEGGRQLRSGGGPETFAVVLGSFRLCGSSTITSPAGRRMHMKVSGSLDGTILSENCFDICDMSGLYMENSHGGIFTTNTFNRCMLGQDASKPASSGTKDPLYDAIVRMKNCKDMLFQGNYFGWMDNGIPAGPPIKTFHMTGWQRHPDRQQRLPHALRAAGSQGLGSAHAGCRRCTRSPPPCCFSCGGRCAASIITRPRWASEARHLFDAQRR